MTPLQTWGLVIVLLVVVAAVCAFTVPVLDPKTSGTTGGKPKTTDHRWTLADVSRLQFGYGKAMGFRPRHLASLMVIILKPGKAATPEGRRWARSTMGVWTSRGARWKLYHHDPPTSLAREIDRRRPKAVVMLGSTIKQLTRMREVFGSPRWTPEVVGLVGEGLTDEEWFRTQEAWAPARVEQAYGASECPLIAMRDRDTGLYHPVGDTKLRCGDGHVDVKGFPSKNWVRLGDAVTRVGAETFAVPAHRDQRVADIMEAGYALQESGQVECFQVQEWGRGMNVEIAYVGDADPDEVASAFKVVFPSKETVTAKKGEAHWVSPDLHVLKQSGYVLR